MKRPKVNVCDAGDLTDKDWKELELTGVVIKGDRIIRTLSFMRSQEDNVLPQVRTVIAVATNSLSPDTRAAAQRWGKVIERETEAETSAAGEVSAQIGIEHYFPKGYGNDEPWKSISEHHYAGLAALREQLEREQESHAQLQSRCYEGFPTVSDGIFDAYRELESHCTDVENEKALALKQNANRDAALKQAKADLERLGSCEAFTIPTALDRSRVSEELMKRMNYAERAALAIQPDSSALKAVIEARGLLPTATLSAGEQPRKETDEALMVSRRIPLEQVDKHFAKRMGDQPTRIWQGDHGGDWWRANGTGYTRKESEAHIYGFVEAYNHTSHCGPEKGIVFEILSPAYTRNLSPDVPLEKATGVSLPKESAGAPSGQTAGVASQKAGQPK